jgi:predicted nucleic acid-binding protein
VLPCDLELAPVWAEVRHRSMTIGRELQPADAWIAATAIHYSLELITRDKDFADLAIPELKVTLYT